MKNRDILKKQLVDNRLMQTDKEIELFEEAMNDLYKENNLENITAYCEAFDDDTHGREVMFSMIHGIENYYNIFSKDLCIDLFLESIPKMKNADDWQDNMFYRILNSDWAIDCLIKTLNIKTENVKETVFIILKRIKMEDMEQFGNNVDFIINSVITNLSDINLTEIDHSKSPTEEEIKPEKPKGNWSVFD